jgi:hypothetical protein
VSGQNAAGFQQFFIVEGLGAGFAERLADLHD